jgi:putative DNA primase/helicase
MDDNPFADLQPPSDEYIERQFAVDRAKWKANGAVPPEPVTGEPDAGTSDQLILSPGTPLVSAREFLRVIHNEANQRTLHHQNATFYSRAPAQTHYIETPTEEMLARLYNFLDEARQPTKKPGVTAPFSPTKSKVSNVLEALAAAAQLPCTARPPSWLDTAQRPQAGELVSCTNGLLHLPTRKLLPHSPAFFSLNALEFAYQHDASPPKVWLRFLNQLWPGDNQSIEMVQEMFGLMLTGRLRPHAKRFGRNLWTCAADWKAARHHQRRPTRWKNRSPGSGRKALGYRR